MGEWHQRQEAILTVTMSFEGERPPAPIHGVGWDPELRTDYLEELAHVYAARVLAAEIGDLEYRIDRSSAIAYHQWAGSPEKVAALGRRMQIDLALDQALFDAKTPECFRRMAAVFPERADEFEREATGAEELEALEQ